MEKLPLKAARSLCCKATPWFIDFHNYTGSKTEINASGSKKHNFDRSSLNDFAVNDKNSPRDLSSDPSRCMEREDLDLTKQLLPWLRKWALEMKSHIIPCWPRNDINALTWTFYLISQNRQVEDKIIKEIKQVLESNRRPTEEDVSRFHYLRKVFTESLRLYPLHGQ